MKSTSVTVNNITPTLVVPADNINRTVYLYSTGNDIFIGNGNVTAAAGFNVKRDTYLQVEIPQGQTLYGITGTVGAHSMQVLSPDTDA